MSRNIMFTVCICRLMSCSKPSQLHCAICRTNLSLDNSHDLWLMQLQCWFSSVQIPPPACPGRPACNVMLSKGVMLAKSRNSLRKKLLLCNILTCCTNNESPKLEPQNMPGLGWQIFRESSFKMFWRLPSSSDRHCTADLDTVIRLRLQLFAELTDSIRYFINSSKLVGLWCAFCDIQLLFVHSCI